MPQLAVTFCFLPFAFELALLSAVLGPFDVKSGPLWCSCIKAPSVYLGPFGQQGLAQMGGLVQCSHCVTLGVLFLPLNSRLLTVPCHWHSPRLPSVLAA